VVELGLLPCIIVIVVFSIFLAGILKEHFFALQLGFSVSGFHGWLQPTGMPILPISVFSLSSTVHWTAY
jgi:hypothetical protein